MQTFVHSYKTRATIELRFCYLYTFKCHQDRINHSKVIIGQTYIQWRFIQLRDLVGLFTDKLFSKLLQTNKHNVTKTK